MIHQILSIVPFPLFPLASGGQKKTYGLLAALAKQNKINVVTPEGETPKMETKPHLFNVLGDILPASFLRYIHPEPLDKLIKLASTSDVITVEQPFYGLMANVIASNAKKKFVIHAHNIEHLRFKSLHKSWWAILKLYEAWVFKKAAAVFFITEQDRAEAISIYKLSPTKCFVSPYGVYLPESKLNIDSIFEAYQISKTHKVFLFFGVLSYEPNQQALQNIIDNVLPQLNQTNLDFTILVCGKGLPANMKLHFEKNGNLKYAGFVEDIDAVIEQCDLVLNPVLTGGGVKTKVLEAIAMNKTVVSTKTGAVGIDKTVCAEKLLITDDDNWQAFTNLCLQAVESKKDTPEKFYKTYSWDAIAEKYMKDLKTVV
ncbi:glycosyltransferase family 4 protein [Chondrinema litorale]|uniref:glycosyltransferase family 4 protein n=1 Tax=Chondrinema litorale TaxID=2994555 RepID=UPI00254349A4|nr:glycosyltransferase family 4 protein [Chondrinema litorale]UZR93904.1 glycosyltransferase family 4 protein [Chondrinema litorale]